MLDLAEDSKVFYLSLLVGDTFLNRISKILQSTAEQISTGKTLAPENQLFKMIQKEWSNLQDQIDLSQKLNSLM